MGGAVTAVKTVRTQGTKTILAPQVCKSRRSTFPMFSENRNCETVTGSENEVLGACAAIPDTFELIMPSIDQQ